MNRVKQTRRGKSDGNCLAASIASILEVKISEFDSLNSNNWLGQVNELLSEFGQQLFLIEKGDITKVFLESISQSVRHIIILRNRGVGEDDLHCVVGMDGEIEFDPALGHGDNYDENFMVYGFFTSCYT